ncbi:MAG: hypothetical protein ACE5KG_06855 [Nitrososphaerales archaeon]
MARAVCLVRDLMDRVKIEAAASGLNLELVFAPTKEGFFEKAANNVPSVFILDLDLNQQSIPILEELGRSEEFMGIPTIGFYQHSNAENAKMAKENGCETILTRSMFAERLPEILKRMAPA